VLLIGAPEVSDNGAVANHNANHNQIDDCPDAAAQLHCRQGVGVNLPRHVNIRHRHANHGELSQNQRAGKPRENTRVLHKVGIVTIFEEHNEDNLYELFIFVQWLMQSEKN
jgi:hypothetical protein